MTNCIVSSSVNRNPSLATRQWVFANNVLYNRSQRFNAVMIGTESAAMHRGDQPLGSADGGRR
jgi:hypothetical protein